MNKLSIAFTIFLVVVSISFASAELFSVSISKPGTCIYSLNEQNYSMESSDGINFISEKFVRPGEHVVFFYCNDTLGNMGFEALKFDETDSNLITYWKFDENNFDDNMVVYEWGELSGFVNDSSGNMKIGWPSNVIIVPDSIEGNSAQFSSGQIEFDGDYLLDGDFSVSFWIKTSSNNLQEIFSGFKFGESYGAIGADDGKVFVEKSSLDNVKRFYSSDISDGSWHNVIVIFNQGDFSIYTDSAKQELEVLNLAQENSLTLKPIIMYTLNGESFETFELIVPSVGKNFEGNIDEFMVYDKAMNENVGDLYNSFNIPKKDGILGLLRNSFNKLLNFVGL